jgi:hypothetical protein
MSSGSSSVASGALASGSTTTLSSGKGYLNSVQVTTDGTNAATATVYDNTAGSGKVLAVLIVAGATLSGSRNFLPALRADIGITVVVSGTGANAYVGYGAV